MGRKKASEGANAPGLEKPNTPRTPANNRGERTPAGGSWAARVARTDPDEEKASTPSAEEPGPRSEGAAPAPAPDLPEDEDDNVSQATAATEPPDEPAVSAPVAVPAAGYAGPPGYGYDAALGSPAGAGTPPVVGTPPSAGSPVYGYAPPPETSVEHVLETVHCPQALVGRLIGKGGETIKDLQRRSGARIQIDQSFPDGAPRVVTVEGARPCVVVGVELVRSLIGNAPAGGGGAPGRTLTFDCPRTLVGRVIGKGGETINELQRRSGARIQIEQRVPEGHPCVVEVQGDDVAVEEARRLIHEVMAGRRLEFAYPAYYAPPAPVYGYGFPQYARAPPAGRPGSPAPGAEVYGAPYGFYYARPAYPGAPGAPYYYGQPGSPHGSPLPGSPLRPGYGDAPPAPETWSAHVDPNSGRTYWHNPATGTTTWDPPPSTSPPPVPAVGAEPPDPPTSR